MEKYEAMVAGPGAGAEGGEQTGRNLPDLRLWPEFGIPAQRMDESPSALTPGVGPLSSEALTPVTHGFPTPAAQTPALPSGQMPRQIAPAAAYDNPGAQDDQTPPDESSNVASPPYSAATPYVPEQATPNAISTNPYPPARPTSPYVPEQPAPDASSTNPYGPEQAAPGTSSTNPYLSATPTTPYVPERATPAPPTTAFVPEQATPAAPETTAAEFGSVPVTAAPPAEPEILAAPPLTAPESAPETKPRKLRSDRHSHRSRMRRQTSGAIVFLACCAVIFLVLHRFLPDAGGIGSLLETWLPWVGVPVLVLLLAAAVVHTKTALVVTVAAALVWTALYGPTMLPRGSSATAQLRIFSEDVNGDAGEATASGTMALAQHAGIVALEDMYSSVYESNAVSALNSAYAYHVTEYEFGLWSPYQITNVQPITLGTTQTADSLSVGSDDAGLAASASAVPVIGALRATLATPVGPLEVYLVHLPQPVLGDQGFAKARDQALTQFVKLLKADHSTRLAVIGDINVAATDRQFSQLTDTDGLTSAQQAAGSGFGFTWPAEFPIVRLDDVLTRGLKPLRSVVLPSIAKGQTHLPIQVDLDY